jgi:class 3 adenylate cyclase/uncharacterized protein HemY
MSSEIEILTQKISSTTNASPQKVDDMNALAALLMDTNVKAAAEAANKAIEAAESIDYQRGQAAALLTAGNAAFELRLFEDADTLYERSLHIREQQQDKEGVGVVRAKLGKTKYFEGKYAEALEHYNRAIEIRMHLGDELGTANLYTNTGAIHGILGNYSLALKSHIQALKIFERYNEESRIAASCSNIGLIYTDQRNFDEALKMFLKALAIRQKENDLRAVSVELNNIGNVYQDQENYREAIEVYHRALNLREQLNDKSKIAPACVNLGSVYRHLKQYERALSYTERALAIFKEINDKRGLIQTYNNLGELYYELKDYERAKYFLNDAIKVAEETGVKNLLRMALDYLSRVNAAEGQYEEAYINHLRYTKLDKEISNAEISGQMAQTTLRYEIEQRAREAELERLKMVELTKAYNSLEDEKKRSEELLLNILPEEVSEELKQFGRTKARSFAVGTVMFADIKGFTIISEQLSAEELVTGLDEYFEAFDRIVDKHGIEKIKTIGDAYLCAGGVPVYQEDHAERVVAAAKDFIAAAHALKATRQRENHIVFDFRIGIHSGPLVAGVVGIKKFAYDIWGDTVNTASRMQQNSEPDKINISESTWQLIKEKFDCEFRGEIEAKNKGRLKMYFVN